MKTLVSPNQNSEFMTGLYLGELQVQGSDWSGFTNKKKPVLLGCSDRLKKHVHCKFKT